MFHNEFYGSSLLIKWLIIWEFILQQACMLLGILNKFLLLLKTVHTGHKEISSLSNFNVIGGGQKSTILFSVQKYIPTFSWR